MSLIVEPGVFEPPADASLAEMAGWLAQCRWAMDRVECAWLEALADFDLDKGWIVDGQLSCAEWLMWRAGMARATAFEKLKVAHELRRRSVVSEAFKAGRVSYSAVRAIARAVGATREVDEALVSLAEVGTVADVERAVRVYLRYADQEREPVEPSTRRGLHLRPQHDGTTRLEAVLTDMEAAELDAALCRVMQQATPQYAEYEASAMEGGEAADGAAGQSKSVPDGPEPVDESAAADRDAGSEATWPQLRADALMHLATQALTAGPPAGDRAMVHIVLTHDSACLLAGDPLDKATLEQVRCDCSTVTHHVDQGGAPLSVGRRRRVWSTTQRRAIVVRDGGVCRWPGCGRTTNDLHHLVPWGSGGPTDVRNGLLLCPRHHRLIHRGWSATGSPSDALTFHRPDAGRTPIGASFPALRTAAAITASVRQSQ